MGQFLAEGPSLPIQPRQGREDWIRGLPDFAPSPANSGETTLSPLPGYPLRSLRLEGGLLLRDE